MRFFHCFALLSCVAFTVPGLADAGEPAVAGYRDYEAFAAACDELAASPRVTKQTIGRTAGGRGVIALTVGGENASRKPAVLVVGSVQADSLVGSHLAMAMVDELVQRSDDGESSVAELLDEVTFYVIPRPSPDAGERFFASPRHAVATNSRPHDDDRDGRIDEDPPADVNGDGYITQMRVADPTGAWISHPDDPRVMIKADRSKGERGGYRLLTEDNADEDDDKRFAEDAIGGIDFNRNFTFKYPYFKPGAGPHQVSEPETRAVADFAFDHPNIFAVFSFAPQANLLKEWKTGGDAAGVVATVADRDAAAMKWMAKLYRDRFQPKAIPDSAKLDGSFAAWAYFHYGRWSLATPGWWPVASDPKDEKTKDKDNKDDDSEPKKSKPKPDPRGKQDRRVLKWLDSAKIDGFVPWTEWTGEPIEGLHGKVEIGGFKPFVSTHPPVEQLDGLGAEHLDFLLDVVAGRPKLVIDQVENEASGDITTHRLRAVNLGQLPTMTRPGERSGKVPRLEAAVALPPGAELLSGSRRRPLPRLDPGVGREVVWVWQGGEGEAATQLGFGYQRNDAGELPPAKPFDEGPFDEGSEEAAE